MKNGAPWVRSYFAEQSNAVQFPTMKKRDDQITLRVAAALRAELEAAARTDDLGLSGLVRKVLIDFAAKRIAERAGAGADVAGAL
jgi:predicted HicB family RNase H-like nuclease